MKIQEFSGLVNVLVDSAHNVLYEHLHMKKLLAKLVYVSKGQSVVR